MRILICGGPRNGKTTLANKLGSLINHQVVSTDNYMDLPFLDVPDQILNEHRDNPRLIVEGVQAARMIGRGYHPDLVILLEPSGYVAPKHQGFTSMAASRVADSTSRVLRLPGRSHSALDAVLSVVQAMG